MLLNQSACHPIRRQRTMTGFSLVEMMVALSFLIVVMLALSQGMMVAVGTNVNGKNNTQALAIAQRLVEDLQNRYGQNLAGYENLAITQNPNNPVIVNYSINGEMIKDSNQRPGFVVTQTVTLDASAEAAYKLVNITVTPQVKGLGKSQPVSVETYIIKPQS